MDSKKKALLSEIFERFTSIVAERTTAEGLTMAEINHLMVHFACLVIATVARVMEADRIDSFLLAVIAQIKVNCGVGTDLRMPDLN